MGATPWRLPQPRVSFSLDRIDTASSVRWNRKPLVSCPIICICMRYHDWNTWLPFVGLAKFSSGLLIDFAVFSAPTWKQRWLVMGPVEWKSWSKRRNRFSANLNEIDDGHGEVGFLKPWHEFIGPPAGAQSEACLRGALFEPRPPSHTLSDNNSALFKTKWWLDPVASWESRGVEQYVGRRASLVTFCLPDFSYTSNEVELLKKYKKV